MFTNCSLTPSFVERTSRPPPTALLLPPRAHDREPRRQRLAQEKARGHEQSYDAHHSPAET
eukprot:494993-Prymnesium_polylepis.1